ncbi:DinB family protein [Paraflavisolibacter sp. H34]|uniref:DinB family protein n=1 Tax=Huijunlia imazamoxiresistens TaxID=3127457 RepID=UPI00301641B6
MRLNQPLLNELRHEADSTRKMLERVPADKFGWKPHEKSMSLASLSSHVAELFSWLTMTLTTDELDFATNKYQPFVPQSTQQLLDFFEDNLKKGTETLAATSDEDMMKHWKLRHGDHIILDLPRMAVLRSFVFNHLVHHRGQLSVYLRLLDVPVPGMYGPSADER